MVNRPPNQDNAQFYSQNPSLRDGPDPMPLRRPKHPPLDAGVRAVGVLAHNDPTWPRPGAYTVNERTSGRLVAASRRPISSSAQRILDEGLGDESTVLDVWFEADHGKDWRGTIKEALALKDQ